MRGYPNGTMHLLAACLCPNNRFVAGKHAKPIVSRPFGTTWRNFIDEVEPQFETSQFFFVNSDPKPAVKYLGKTVMLIDERAISQAEQTGLFLKAANNTVFVGSATAGANGTVSKFYVPGGLCINFTGEAIVYADGTQLQRRGLQPDILIKPTIAGIRAGRDELLEKAIEFLS
jgi:C-terminal processing protease CtpA/Prc